MNALRAAAAIIGTLLVLPIALPLYAVKFALALWLNRRGR